MSYSFRYKDKNFWQRPEGVTGAIFCILISFGLIFLLYKYISFVDRLFEDLLLTVIFFASVVFVLFILIFNKTRRLFWHVFKNIMKKITSFFVDVDYFDILENDIRFLHKNQKELDIHATTLNEQIINLQDYTNKNSEEIVENKRITGLARKKKNMERVAANMRQYEVLKINEERYSFLLDNMERFSVILTKIHNNAEFLIRETENELSLRQQEFENINKECTGWQRLKNIMNDQKDRKYFFCQTMDEIIDVVHFKIAETEILNEIAENFVDSIDIRRGYCETEGLDRLVKMESENNCFLLGDNVKEEEEFVFI